MKKLFASVAALFLTAAISTVSAQAIMNDDSHPFRYGVQVGLNVPTFANSQYGYTVGWNIGGTLVYDLQDFIPNSYARASVLYSRKGASGEDAVIYPYIEKPKKQFENPSFTLHYIETPVRFGWAYEILGGNIDMSVIAETGPYLGFRIWDSMRHDGYSNYGETNKWEHVQGSEEKGKEHMGDHYGDLRYVDFGWGLHAGLLLDKKYQISLGYDWGITDVEPSGNRYSITGPMRNLSINFTAYFD